MNPMTMTSSATTGTGPATVTDDTAEQLGRAEGNFRAAYWSAVDRARDLEYSPTAGPEEVATATAEVARLLTSWKAAQMAFETYRAGLRMGTHSAPGVVFVEIEEYARRSSLSWTRVAA